MEGDVVGLRITLYDPETSQRAQRDIPTTTASLIQLVGDRVDLLLESRVRVIQLLRLCCRHMRLDVFGVEVNLYVSVVVNAFMFPFVLAPQRVELVKHIIQSRLVLGPSDAMRYFHTTVKTLIDECDAEAREVSVKVISNLRTLPLGWFLVCTLLKWCLEGFYAIGSCCDYRELYSPTCGHVSG